MSSQRQGFVYFVQICGSQELHLQGDGPIKIGFARCVAARMNSLQICMPYSLKLLLQIRGTANDEKKLHRQFMKHCIRGEWFRAERPIYEHIEALRSAGMNVGDDAPAGDMPNGPVSAREFFATHTSMKVTTAAAAAGIAPALLVNHIRHGKDVTVPTAKKLEAWSGGKISAAKTLGVAR